MAVESQARVAVENQARAAPRVRKTEVIGQVSIHNHVFDISSFAFSLLLLIALAY